MSEPAADRSPPLARPSRRERLRQLRRRVTYSSFVTGLIACGLWLFIWLYFKTLRVEYVYHPDFDREQRDRVCYGFWHGRQFLLVPSFGWVHPAIMTDISWMGAIQAKILRRFGYVVVRGSSKRRGAQALLEVKQELEAGRSAAFALDGPRGPIHQAKPGIVFLAQKLGYPIVPLLASAERAWELDNWCRYQLPKPFSRCWVGVGQPFSPAQFDRDAAVQECNRRVNCWLAELDRRAGHGDLAAVPPAGDRAAG
ncbi:MAG: DUF374 domain-containing protein [Deltaproteobacteria bacterium]|nr:DUF374 domain-containing protein [Deltaproteobacteria bacterium]